MDDPMRTPHVTIAVATIALLGLLSLLGHLLWPLELPGPAVAGPPLPAPTPLSPEPDRGLPTRVESVVVDAPGGQLAGMVVEPVASEPGRTAVVLVAGGGPARAADLVGPAQALAAQGLTVLAYDKRTVGYNALQHDYAALAQDALAALALVRARPGVDRTGLLGISEGGWVLPIAADPAAGAAGPDFVVLVSAAGVSPGEQVVWLLDSGLVDQDAPVGARAALIAAQATGLPGGLLAYTRYDPVPALRALRVPVLAVFGTRDRVVPIVDSARLLLAASPGTGVWMIPGADHGMALPDGTLAPQFAPGVAAWIRGLPGTAGSGDPVRGAQATQDHPALALPPEPLGGGALVLAGFALVAAGALAGPVAGRLTGRGRDRTPRRRRSRRLALSAVGGTLAVNAGLGGLAAVSAVGGGPVAVAAVWTLLRAAGVVVAVVTVHAVVGASADKPSNAERVGWIGALTAAGAALVLAASAGLFAPLW